jgi:hypothetical protein
LDGDRFAADLRSPASEEAFEADLGEVRDPPQDARHADAIHRDKKGRERISFPSALLIGDERRQGAWGNDSVDPEKLREAVLRVGAKQRNEGGLKLAEAIRRFGRCATRELEVLTGKPLPALEAELWKMASDGKLKAIRVLTGTLWEAA